MLRIQTVSGEELVALDLASFLETQPAGMHPVRALKQHLHSICGVPRFRQRLVCLDGKVVLEDDGTLRPGEVQVVLLRFCPPSNDQVTALRDAAGRGVSAEVETLLQRPQDPDLGDPAPLFEASKHGQIDVVRLLLEAKADMDKATQDGATPLYSAAAYGQLEVARLLLEANADQDKATQDGETPLFIAAQLGQLEVARFLLEANADTDKARQDGATPLFIAAAHGQLEVVRLLLEAKADMGKATQDGSIPLHSAAAYGQLEVARLLLEANADKDKATQDGETPLFIAAQLGQLEVARFLLEANADTDKARQDGATPLFIAAAHGQLEVVRLLLEAKADMDKATQDGATPLYSAAAYGQLEVARLLLEANADQDKATQDGETPLFIAAQLGQLEVARFLLEANADTDKARQDGATPLFIAAAHGQLEVVRLLLEAKADMGKATQDGSIPLHSAAAYGQLEVARLLLEANADKDKATQDGETPLFIAAQLGQLQVARFLLEANADTDKAATPLFIAAQLGQLEVARFLLEANADKDKARQDGETPLFIAAQLGQLEVARLLLEAKADTDKAMQDGATPLFIAAAYGQLEVARFLLEANADTDKARQDGATPLFIAAQKGQLEVARFLLEAKADTDKAMQDGATPLYSAARQGQLEVVRLLLEAKADMGKATQDGSIPLHGAAAYGQLEVARFLLEANADTDKSMQDGATPLYSAAQEGQLEVARFLLEANADKDKATQDGETPLFIAAQQGQLEVARLLLEANADTDKARQDGATPLFIAAQRGQLEVARLLQESNTDKNKRRRRVSLCMRACKCPLFQRLHLQWQGFAEICGLEPFESAEVLYLQANRIERIENLECMPRLQFLALQCNRIAVVENLLCLPDLEFLDLSRNEIAKLDVKQLPKKINMLNFRGNACAEAPDYLPSLLAHLWDQLKNVQHIQASFSAFAAILDDGSVVTWGSAADGGDSRAVQDQLKNVQHIHASRSAFAAILADGSVVTWGYPEHGGDSSTVRDQLKNTLGGIISGDVMLNHSNIGWKDWLFMPLRPSLLIERPKDGAANPEPEKTIEIETLPPGSSALASYWMRKNLHDGVAADIKDCIDAYSVEALENSQDFSHKVDIGARGHCSKPSATTRGQREKESPKLVKSPGLGPKEAPDSTSEPDSPTCWRIEKAPEPPRVQTGVGGTRVAATPPEAMPRDGGDGMRATEITFLQEQNKLVLETLERVEQEREQAQDQIRACEERDALLQSELQAINDKIGSLAQRLRQDKSETASKVPGKNRKLQKIAEEFDTAKADLERQVAEAKSRCADTVATVKSQEENTPTFVQHRGLQNGIGCVWDEILVTVDGFAAAMWEKSGMDTLATAAASREVQSAVLGGVLALFVHAVKAPAASTKSRIAAVSGNAVMSVVGAGVAELTRKVSQISISTCDGDEVEGSVGRAITGSSDCGEEASSRHQWLWARALDCRWKLSRGDFKVKKELSRTLKSTLYQASWQGVDVVVKCAGLHDDTALRFWIKERAISDELLHEIDLLSSLRHPDLLMFLGACIEPHMPIMCVTEFLPAGDLERYFVAQRKKHNAAIWRPVLIQVIQWSSAIGRALSFLHDRDVVHRDLKPLNLLLTKHLEIKVSDFGISRLMARECDHYAMTGGVGSYRYMAPEVVRHEAYDQKVDIYAYGLIMYLGP
ncbi:Ankyrin-3 [Symbiodinium microadriaticum]|uniref:Ankyrin-3 n=1 Tax=Symbiodinium microadriaticum TaxID=2951 RepID=A0A1Q9DN43_SYMMI|nr:Ankyrin-3 [Symbiodinium microadriaticum]